MLEVVSEVTTFKHRQVGQLLPGLKLRVRSLIDARHSFP